MGRRAAPERTGGSGVVGAPVAIGACAPLTPAARAGWTARQRFTGRDGGHPPGRTAARGVSEQELQRARAAAGTALRVVPAERDAAPATDPVPALSDGAPVGASDAATTLPGVLTAAGFPGHIVEHLCAIAAALPRDGASAGRPPHRASDAHLVAAADALVVVQRWADAALAEVLVDLAAATGEELLPRADVAGPEELSSTARDRWRAKTKSVLANEVQVLTGWGIQDCHDRVGFALSPPSARTIPLQAMATGEAQWCQVRAWWSTCRRLPVEVAAQLGARTFSPGSDRARSHRDRGISEEHTARSSYGETKGSLARLLAALLAEDPAQARRDRRRRWPGEMPSRRSTTTGPAR